VKFKVFTAELMEIPDFKVRSVCISFNMNQLGKIEIFAVNFKYII